MVKIFDYNDDGYLDVEDFLLFILPQNEKLLRIKAEQKIEAEDFYNKPLHESFICEVARLLILEAEFNRKVDQ